MTRFGLVIVTIAVTLLAGTQVHAGSVPGNGGLPPLKPMVVPLSLLPPPKPQASRYPMTYSENVARSLGVEGGLLNLGSQPRNPYLPSLSVDGSMLHLRWRP